jgi:Uncharacterized proteins, LmbE homologs
MTLRDMIKVPDLEACKRVLCVQPHPDDNEVGAGATIAKLAASGCEVAYLTATDGALGTRDPSIAPEKLATIRKAEIEKAAGILGVTRLMALGIRDASYPDEGSLCRRIVAVLREVRPEIVLVCDPFLIYECHPDHRRVGMATLEACIFAANPHFEAEPKGQAEPWQISAVALHTTGAPNVFVDVAATWETKFRAMAAHASQFPAPELAQLRPYFDFKAAEYGARAGCAAAEAFKVLPPMLMHMVVDSAQF